MPQEDCAPLFWHFVRSFTYFFFLFDTLIISLGKGSWLIGKMQLTLVTSKSMGLSEILRAIRTSTYQICRTEGPIIEQPHFTKEYLI